MKSYALAVTAFALTALALPLAGCTPAAPDAAAATGLAGPYRIVSVKDIFADAPVYKAGDDLKTFLDKRLDWAFAPGRPPLAVMDPEADLREAKLAGATPIRAAEAALAAEGHKAARMVVAMDVANGGGQGDLKALAAEGYEPAMIFADSIGEIMADTPTAKEARQRLAGLEGRYPMAKMVLGLVLADLDDTNQKAEGIRLLSELHELDPIMVQTLVTTLYFMKPQQPVADKVARQMLEAYMASPAATANEANKQVRQGSMLVLGSMLEQGRGGSKDPERAAKLYSELVEQSHPSCEIDAVAGLTRLGKPTPVGTGQPCQSQALPAQSLETLPK